MWIHVFIHCFQSKKEEDIFMKLWTYIYNKMKDTMYLRVLMVVYDFAKWTGHRECTWRTDEASMGPRLSKRSELPHCRAQLWNERCCSCLYREIYVPGAVWKCSANACVCAHCRTLLCCPHNFRACIHVGYLICCLLVCGKEKLEWNWATS